MPEGFVSITDAYTLRTIRVEPSQLLLDPNNPRFVTTSPITRRYTPAQVADPTTQDWIRSRVRAKEHHVQRLIDSIREIGFVGGVHEIIVKSHGRGKYLALEGNRRTAALQFLLANPDQVRPDVLQSIQKIDVKEFSFQGSPGLSEQDVIETILGSIHVAGPQEWGALERSQFFLNRYARNLGVSPYSQDFAYDQAVAKEVAASFSMTPAALKKQLTIARVYMQIGQLGRRVGWDPVTPAHYTLIHLAVTTRSVAHAAFELQAASCTLSEDGAELFHQVCVDRDGGGRRVINSPQEFKSFARVWKEGTDTERSNMVERNWTLAQIIRRLDGRKQRRGFLSALQGIDERLASLPYDGYQGTLAEQAVIRRIRSFVDRLETLVDDG